MGELRVLAAHQVRKLFVYDFDDLLAGGEAFKDFRADCALGNGFDEILGNGVVYIGLEKRHAHFSHSGFYIRFGKLSATGQLFKRILKFFGKALKRHGELTSLSQ